MGRGVDDVFIFILRTVAYILVLCKVGAYKKKITGTANASLSFVFFFFQLQFWSGSIYIVVSVVLSNSSILTCVRLQLAKIRVTAPVQSAITAYFTTVPYHVFFFYKNWTFFKVFNFCMILYFQWSLSSGNSGKSTAVTVNLFFTPKHIAPVKIIMKFDIAFSLQNKRLDLLSWS